MFRRVIIAILSSSSKLSSRSCSYGKTSILQPASKQSAGPGVGEIDKLETRISSRKQDMTSLFFIGLEPIPDQANLGNRNRNGQTSNEQQPGSNFRSLQIGADQKVDYLVSAHIYRLAPIQNVIAMMITFVKSFVPTSHSENLHQQDATQ